MYRMSLNVHSVQSLEEENIFRKLAKIIQTSSGDRKIPVVTTHIFGLMARRRGLYPDTDEVFGQTSIGAYKLGTFIKVSDELLNDSVFDLPVHISTEFAAVSDLRKKKPSFGRRFR